MFTEWKKKRQASIMMDGQCGGRPEVNWRGAGDCSEWKKLV